MYEIALYTKEKPEERPNLIIIGVRHLVPNIECYLSLWTTDTYNKEELDNDTNLIRYLVLTKGEQNASN